jgi:HAMP domain-containing protein
MAKTKGILLAVGVVAAAGIAYVTLKGPGGPSEGVQGTMGAVERHQTEKTRYYDEMNKLGNTDKIETLGRIAARFESAPAEAEKMLEEHGWSEEEFQKMVKSIRSDDELNKLFEEAKKKASQ